MYKPPQISRLTHAIICLLAIFGIVFHIGCRKTIEEKTHQLNSQSQSSSEQSGGGNPESACDLSNTICEDCNYQEGIDEGEDDSPTVLGNVYNNPYSIPNMTAAFNFIYYSSISEIATTHNYVRFKPTTLAQLDELESLDIELFDYPLNRHVEQDGDYWPDAYTGLAQNEYPWLYSVVEKTLTLPSGVQKEVLESLHIPDDNAVLEDEAFYISGNSVCDSTSYVTIRQERREFYRLAPIDPCDFGALDICGGSGGGGGGVHPSLKPSGQINFRTYVTGPGERISATAPLKFARIVGKRFFKIDKTYTNASGNFQFAKRFPRKVTIIVKFKASVAHGQHSVRVDFTDVGFWRSMYPLKKNIGTYRGNDLQNLNYVFQKGSNAVKRKTKQWLAAVIMNTTEESRLFFAEKGMQQLPDDLRLYLYAPQDQITNVPPQYDFIRRSNAPWLNQDRDVLNDIIDWGSFTFLAAATVFVAISSGGYIPATTLMAAIAFSAVPHAPDVYFYYNTEDVTSLTSTKVSISAGQQIALCYLYNLTKNSTATWINQSHYKRSLQTGFELFTLNDYTPFGNNVPRADYFPSIVAIWQGFAQHFGHTISDRIYGTGAGNFELQGATWISDFSESSNMKFLEAFNPQSVPPFDYFSWIPVGLYNDLMDSNVDPSIVVDNVSGFTYSEIQSALYNKPVSVSDFKTQLQAIKPAQSVQLDQLFASYGY
jgi:hypothetical protein